MARKVQKEVRVRTGAWKKVRSPVGELTLVASDAGLVALVWEHDRPGRVKLDLPADCSDAHPVLVQTERELAEYFAGSRKQFTVPMDRDGIGGTEFQRAVWNALETIPFGEVRSYTALARQIGRPRAIHAVGAAVASNPVSILMPCHRAVGLHGSLTGYAGGLPAKERLLALEGARSGELVF